MRKYKKQKEGGRGNWENKNKVVLNKHTHIWKNLENSTSHVERKLLFFLTNLKEEFIIKILIHGDTLIK